MRQILLNNRGAVVARVPAPTLETGRVLVRVHYSLISVGTEVAALRPPALESSISSLGRAKSAPHLARAYLTNALRNPEKVVRRARRLAQETLAGLLPRATAPPSPLLGLGALGWTRAAAQSLELRDGRMEVVTDDSAASYQALSQAIEIASGCVPVVEVRGRVHEGAIAIGLLDENRAAWLGSRTYESGAFEDQLAFDPRGSGRFTVVVTTAGAGRPSRATVEAVDVLMHASPEGGLPVSELDDQGWNVGYSAAGEVIAAGAGIADLAAGDLVACAGAGLANHADYVSVPRNLVCRVPAGCPLSRAASATVGTIALQGVRRARPQLGERVCVLGLGLIGQITAQLLRASGCKVIGLDLDRTRVERARKLGMDAGAHEPDGLRRLVRDVTGGHGADRTLITASSRSDEVINLAMELTRAKGTVVVVGDVGLNVRREHFYRKEIDLLMSTSYGPGRYDRSYEAEGRDYPFPYVRWTLNRNMESYLELLAAGRVDVEALVDRTVRIDQAPAAYEELARGREGAPLAVLIRYPDDPRELPEAPQASRITIRGHRKAPERGPIRYALVGAGAFGTSMLVPQLKKQPDRFFLRGLVSRDASRGGNFARANQVEVLATDIDTVLLDPGFELVVIATRHHEHGDQVARSLRAGKHVFVEKPLALTWEELERVERAYRDSPAPPVLMVGFNRRFSPALQVLREALAERRSPLVMSYRVNAGYVPPDSWLHGPEGGGRNLGEACHMYDVFRFLAAAPVSSIDATAIQPGALPYRRNDNFSATLSYKDGSVATLVYTALGPKQGLAKERLEVFADGEAWVVEDFKSVARARDGEALWSAAEPDKGHAEELLRLGEAIVHAGESPTPFDELVETTGVALQIENLLHERIGSR